MYAIKKKSKIWPCCILPENGRSLKSLSFKSLILVKKQEPEQASQCPGVGVYPKNRNNDYLNEATIMTSRRKIIKVLVYSTDFWTEFEYFQVRVRALFEINFEYSEKLYILECTRV